MANRSFTVGCRYMLFDMGNEEIIRALRENGWSVDVKGLGCTDWRPAFVGKEYEYEDKWCFRITKGDREYERSVDLYPIANKVLNS